MMFPSARGVAIILTAAGCLACIFGCASSASIDRDKGEVNEERATLEKYESLFKPSDYDPPVETIEGLVRADTTGKGQEEKTLEPIPAETAPGFRIQVLSTTEIDTANSLKAELSWLPETIGIYVIYDPPYYKVRIGDFPTRPDANPLLRNLQERGYADAWIVPDRVLKNPPRRLPPPPTKEPE